jgi:site-specific DNA-cytosine methylase
MNMDTILDLCCGAGGSSCGFQLARKGDRYIGVDIWKLALGTYFENIQGPVEVIWASLDPRDAIRKLVPMFDVTTIGHVDKLIFTPPCPDFSGANINGKRNKDPTLVNICFKIRDYLKPRWWIMEESPFAAHLVEHPRFLCANDFGLYQKRRRLFAGNYPEILPTRHCKKIHPAIRAQEVKAFNGNMRHSPKAQSCCQWFGRRLSSLELQVLMGFPPGYKFHGNYNERCIQIGNAVCPPVAKAIHEAIIKAETG